MTAERERDLERICRAALERPVAERASFLADACGDNADLRQAAERLVAQEEAAASSFLETPAWVIAIREMAASMAGHSTAARATTMSAAPSGDRVEPSDRLAQHGPLDGANFAPGQIFAGRHRIVSLLGCGAMGEVYRAEDLKLGQPVALKLVATRAARGDEHVRRSLAEVRLARVIAHPNVCRVYDIGEADGWCYISMELVDGETLASLLRRIGRLPAEKALDMARQLCAGLAAAHDCGVLHRDLKPSNIMVDGRGRIRILDFGLAVPSGEWTVGEIAGTPAYMAPEQLVAGRATEQTDLYALGLVLYELYAGRPLVSVQTLEERRHVSSHDISEAPSLPGIDPEIERIIHACLNKDPAERPRSALAVAAFLPGGDPLTAALAEGRVPSPDMIAAAGHTGALHPGSAWALLAAVLGGTLAVASQVHVITVGPSDVPKSPEVLAERARNILAAAGYEDAPADSAFWFRPSSVGPHPSRYRSQVTGEDDPFPIRFAYRQSPQYLVPQNPLHVVTDTDPPSDVPGMATVLLDPKGHLLRLSAIAGGVNRRSSSNPPLDSRGLFAEAGLIWSEFAPAKSAPIPLVPHDSRIAWEGFSTTTNRRLRVVVATLAQKPVYFEVTSADAVPAPDQSWLGGYATSPFAAPLLLGFTVALFAGGGVLARRNLRLGYGDTRGAQKLFAFTTCSGVIAAVLTAHHVGVAADEWILLLFATGVALVWGGFAWVMYISLEPYVRKWWPHTLISWTRLVSGRVRDPLVGRDVLAGLLAGVAFVVLLIVRFELARRTGLSLTGLNQALPLEALGSVSHYIGQMVFMALEALLFTLGGLGGLLLIRVVVRSTWLSAVVWTLAAAAGGGPFGLDPASGLPIAAFAVAILLRLGLLSSAVMLLFAELLTRFPITFDFGAWYMGSSLMTLLLIGGAATYGFRVALAGRPAFNTAR